MIQPPMISGYDDYSAGLDDIVEQLAGDMGRVDFVYNDMCALSVHVTRHLGAGAFALTVGYTNRTTNTRIWWPGGDAPRMVAQALDLYSGHDTNTLESLLRDLGDRLVERRLAVPR